MVGTTLEKIAYHKNNETQILQIPWYCFVFKTSRSDN